MRIASDIFKLQPTEYCTGTECETYLRADGRAVNGMDNYHLILFGWGYEYQYPNILLYHSEEGLIEELPFRYSDGFSFDGRWLFLSRLRGEDADTTTNQLWLRPVDHSEGAPQLLLSTPLSLYWHLSPDGTKLSVGAEFPRPSYRGFVYLFSLPEGEQIEIWNTGEDWVPLSTLWSPDGKFLAVQANEPSPIQENVLFIIPLP